MRFVIGVGLVALGALLVAPIATVRVGQQTERRQVVATLRAGRMAQLVETETPGLTRIDLAVTSVSRPAPRASLRLIEVPGGTERTRVALPRRLPPPGGHEYTSLRFPVIHDSAGRTYQVWVESAGPPDGTELRLWGRLTPGATADGQLAYRAWHRTTGGAALSILGARLADAPLGAAGMAAAAVTALAYGAAFVFFAGRPRAEPG